MSERLQIASNILAHLLATERVAKGLAENGPITIHKVSESCLDAADALIKSAQDTRNVADIERKLLNDLCMADIDLGCLIHLKERARRLFGYGL